MKEDIEEAETGHRARQAGEYRDQEVSRIGQPDLDVLGEVIAQNGRCLIRLSPVTASGQSKPTTPVRRRELRAGLQPPCTVSFVAAFRQNQWPRATSTSVHPRPNKKLTTSWSPWNLPM